MELEATILRDNNYAVRPKGCLGTMGWKDGIAWTIVYVNAKNEKEAIQKARRVIANPKNTVYMPMRAALGL